VLAAADILRERINTSLWPTAQERHERLVDGLRGAVGLTSYAAAYERGTRIDDAELYDLAMQLTEHSALAPTAS